MALRWNFLLLLHYFDKEFTALPALMVLFTWIFLSETQRQPGWKMLSTLKKTFQIS
jgi:hypothetical protein